MEQSVLKTFYKEKDIYQWGWLAFLKEHKVWLNKKLKNTIPRWIKAETFWMSLQTLFDNLNAKKYVSRYAILKMKDDGGHYCRNNMRCFFCIGIRNMKSAARWMVACISCKITCYLIGEKIEDRSQLFVSAWWRPKLYTQAGQTVAFAPKI